MIKQNKALKSCYDFWQIHNTKKGYPEDYPDEEVVRFLMRLKSNTIKQKKQIKDIKILDLATGSGKNIQPIMDIGFKLYCIDWSKGGLNYIKKKYKKKNIHFTWLDFVNSKLVYNDDYFDAVIATSVFDHILKKDCEKLLSEVHRVTKKNGLMISNLMTTKTTKKGRVGTKIQGEKNTYLVETGNSAGEIHSLFERNIAKKFFSKYFITNKTVDYKITFNEKYDLNVLYSSLKKK